MIDHPLLRRITSFFLDVRVIAVVLQIVFVVLVIVALGALADSAYGQLSARNIAPTFDFLDNRAGFQLADSGDYTPDDTYWEAFLVGVRNTLRVVLVGLVLTTILGVLVGIFLLSHNWLVRNIARVYVEILRNTPLLVQIFVWFYVVILALPLIQDSLRFPPEGIIAVPLRWLLFLLAIPVIAAITRRLPENSLLRMLMPIIAIGVAAVLEAANAFPMELARFEAQPIVLLSNRGVALPALNPTARFDEWMIIVLAGFVVAVALHVFLGRRTEATGRRYPRLLYAIGVMAAALVVGWVAVSALPPPATALVEVDGETVEMPLEQARAEELIPPEQEALYDTSPLTVTVPERRGLRYGGGIVLLPEYTALLLALVVYTSAFIAEIVRAGIQAVPHGQIEAARALGLSYVDSLRLIILPQALRVIIPPLGNQYLNLAKNSSLAIAISYTDVFQVTGTIINQTGQSVSGILMVMLAYLIMSLIIAFIMNLVNSRFQLASREQRQQNIFTHMRDFFRKRVQVVTR